MEMEMRDWADLAVAMFFTHWILTIPMPIALFFVGPKKPSDLTVWMLVSAWYAYSLLMPYVPGSATGSAGMIYLILPDLVPFFVFVPYAIGVIFRQLH